MSYGRVDKGITIIAILQTILTVISFGCLIALVFYGIKVLQHPEMLGEFVGKIVAGFKSVSK